MSIAEPRGAVRARRHPVAPAHLLDGLVGRHWGARSHRERLHVEAPAEGAEDRDELGQRRERAQRLAVEGLPHVRVGCARGAVGDDGDAGAARVLLHGVEERAQVGDVVEDVGSEHDIGDGHGRVVRGWRPAQVDDVDAPGARLSRCLDERVAHGARRLDRDDTGDARAQWEGEAPAARTDVEPRILGPSEGLDRGELRALADAGAEGGRAAGPEVRAGGAHRLAQALHLLDVRAHECVPRGERGSGVRTEGIRRRDGLAPSVSARVSRGG